MAEIRIRKKSGPVWPWIVGVLFLLAALWFMVEFVFTEEGIRIESSKKETTQYRELEGLGEFDPSQTYQIDEFIAMVNDRTFIEENVDEAKAKHGMKLLSEALDEVIVEHNIQSQDILADKIVLSEQVNGSDMSKENETRNSRGTDELARSFYTAANLLEGIQREKYPDLEMEIVEVRESAQSIIPSENISDQGDQVKDFLIKIGHALQSMRDGIYEEAYHNVPENSKLINLTK